MINREFFPQYGRVVILDDKIDEVGGLITLLSLESIPFVYFDRVPDEYDEYSNLGIRIVFLDLVLEGVTGQKDVKSILYSNLTRLIKADNGPYVIAIWSTQKEHYQKEIQELEAELPFPPNKVLYLDKSKYKSYFDELKDDLQAHFEDVFKNCELLSFISLWENSINNSMITVMSKYDNLLPEGHHDINSYASNLASMMLAEHAFTEEIDNQDRISLAYEGLNLLLNKESNFRNYCISAIAAGNITLQETKIAFNKNRANTLLWIGERYPYCAPKNVYKTDVKIEPSPFSKAKVEDAYAFIEIDITHKCTYCYNKTIKSGHQFVKAALFPKDKYKQGDERGNYLLNVGEIVYEEKDMILVVLLNQILHKTEQDIEMQNAIFSISDELYTEVRTAIAKTYGQSGKIEFK